MPEDSNYSRTPFLIVSRWPAVRKDVYGSIEDHVVLQAQLIRSEHPNRSVVISMHPIGSPAYLPMFSGLARAGYDVIACATRYSSGDAALQMENVLLDLGACVRDARERLGYERVLLAGWSGGGALVLGYQAEAEKPVIRETASHEFTALADAKLPPADGVLVLAAHRSRHHLLTDFLDPSVVDEFDLTKRDPTWNLYDPRCAERAPFSSEFLLEYRRRQVERSSRITAMAQSHQLQLKAAGRAEDEYCFVVQGTLADPRWLDTSIEPNDRTVGSFLGDPRIANDSAVGLARFTTTRGWLSQWSLETAQVDGVESARRITVPTLVIVNSADNACPVSHNELIFSALASEDKTTHVITGADHYYSGPDQKQHLSEATSVITEWCDNRGFDRRNAGSVAYS